MNTILLVFLGGFLLVKTVDDYIRELKEMSAKSKFKNDINLANTPPMSDASGKLIISVSHSQNTFPVANAEYFVYDKNGNSVASGITDISGKSEEIVLPAIPKGVSEQPGTQLINSAVFYDVGISAENYIPFTIKNIPVFEGVTTLQNFDMTFFSASPDGLPQTITLPTENTL